MKTDIEIATDTGPMTVEAEVFGAWAVHLSPDMWTHGRGKPKRALTITHVTTGLAARHPSLVGISWRDARIVAKRLNDAYPVLPHDVMEAARGERDLSAASAETMRQLGEFIVEAAIQARKANRAKHTSQVMRRTMAR